MKIKRLMRFYFFAGSLNKTLDDIIMNIACSSGADVYCGGLVYAERIAEIVQAKESLARLWARLNGVMEKLTERDRNTLKLYGALRVGPRGEIKKEIHRAAVKFTRRAGGILSAESAAYETLCALYCLLRTG